MQDKVSIITPSWNSEKYIKRQLNLFKIKPIQTGK